jgi:hypothetical protein
MDMGDSDGAYGFVVLPNVAKPQFLMCSSSWISATHTVASAPFLIAMDKERQLIRENSIRA